MEMGGGVRGAGAGAGEVARLGSLCLRPQWSTPVFNHASQELVESLGKTLVYTLNYCESQVYLIYDSFFTSEVQGGVPNWELSRS